MTTIILTTTVYVNKNKDCLFQVDPNNRLKLYLESITKWLEETPFNIIVVDNSGYQYNEFYDEKRIYHHRFEVISFKENELKLSSYLKNIKSKGASEIFAINYAFYNSRLRHKTNFIIKVTGRFFVKKLVGFLNQHDLTKYDAIRQFDIDRCELVGCRHDHFWYIFNIALCTDANNYEPHIETIWRDRILKYDNIITCDAFPINPTQRGGVNESFDII
jgi:hypothetical protein